MIGILDLAFLGGVSFETCSAPIRNLAVAHVSHGSHVDMIGLL
jgi:hypothetical protein